ncbi:hypothetical protein B0H17DRAFT_1146927 [Mycena rosella]|uniref:Uncharacterized protein n=1 Tax=Mycena rosella TaxID=1033263 RepID=A0AAD7CMT6_MYCRO|nr:hypothetical protein B0H17DRAFT_1146927 [Mycena rosella]
MTYCGNLFLSAAATRCSAAERVAGSGHKDGEAGGLWTVGSEGKWLGGVAQASGGGRRWQAGVSLRWRLHIYGGSPSPWAAQRPTFANVLGGRPAGVAVIDRESDTPFPAAWENRPAWWCGSRGPPDSHNLPLADWEFLPGYPPENAEGQPHREVHECIKSNKPNMNGRPASNDNGTFSRKYAKQCSCTDHAVNEGAFNLQSSKRQQPPDQ